MHFLSWFIPVRCYRNLDSDRNLEETKRRTNKLKTTSNRPTVALHDRILVWHYCTYPVICRAIMTHRISADISGWVKITIFFSSLDRNSRKFQTSLSPLKTNHEHFQIHFHSLPLTLFYFSNNLQIHQNITSWKYCSQ